MVRSNNRFGWLKTAALVAAVVLVLMGSLGLLLRRGVPTPEFPVEGYLEGKTAASDQAYTLEGSVKNEIVAVSGDAPGCYTVQVDESAVILPVFVREVPAFGHLHKEQKIKAQVRIGPNKELLASQIEKQ